MILFDLLDVKIFFISLIFGVGLFLIFSFFYLLFFYKNMENFKKNIFFAIFIVFFTFIYLIFSYFFNFGKINFVLMLSMLLSFLFCKKTFFKLVAIIHKKMYNIKKEKFR